MTSSEMSYIDVQNETTAQIATTKSLHIKSQSVQSHVIRHPQYYQSKEGVFYHQESDKLIQVVLPNKRIIQPMLKTPPNIIKFNKNVYWNPQLLLQTKPENIQFYDKTKTTSSDYYERNENVAGYVEWTLS